MEEKVCRTSTLPESWKNPNITLIHKKEDGEKLNNYLSISLLSVFYRIFSNVSNRIRATLDMNQTREKAGYEKRFPAINTIHVITQVTMKSAEGNQSFYADFIDYETVFDSVNISAVKEPLSIQRLQEAYMNILGNIYRHLRAFLYLHTKSYLCSQGNNLRGHNVSSGIARRLTKSIQAIRLGTLRSDDKR